MVKVKSNVLKCDPSNCGKLGLSAHLLQALFRVATDTPKINHKYLLDASAKFRNAPSMQEIIIEIQKAIMKQQVELIELLKSPSRAASDNRNGMHLTLINEAIEIASMDTASFGNLWTEEKDPLPKTEAEVTEFIRRRTRLWRETWIIAPLKQIACELKGATK